MPKKIACPRLICPEKPATTSTTAPQRIHENEDHRCDGRKTSGK